MNSFGQVFRLTLLGESHGAGVGVVVDGCPAGLELGAGDFAEDLERRRGGPPGATSRTEEDRPEFLSGLFQGRTTGAPLALWFANSQARSQDYAGLEHLPRPGHADLAARLKYGGFADPRGGGMFSGRLTVGLVAAGVVAKKLLGGIKIRARLVGAGGSDRPPEAIEAARAEGDSVGGLVACRADGVAAGLGEPWFDSIESLLSHLLFAIPGVKGVDFGAGFELAGMRGSRANDAILDADGRTATNFSGGINGGITNGNPLEFRVAFRPTPSIALPQRTVDLRTGEPAQLRVAGRHDACIALRAVPVVEAACAVVLADLMLLAGRLPRVLSRAP